LPRAFCAASSDETWIRGGATSPGVRSRGAWSRRRESCTVAEPEAGLLLCVSMPKKECYNKTPSHNTGHGTGAHWHLHRYTKKRISRRQLRLAYICWTTTPRRPPSALTRSLFRPLSENASSCSTGAACGPSACTARRRSPASNVQLRRTRRVQWRTGASPSRMGPITTGTRAPASSRRPRSTRAIPASRLPPMLSSGRRRR